MGGRRKKADYMVGDIDCNENEEFLLVPCG